MKKRLVQMFIASVLVGSLVTVPVLAAPSVDELEEKKAAAENEVNDLQSELNTLLAKMNDLENKLIKKGQELEQSKEDLKAAEKKQQKQYEDMKLRIQYMYEEGDNSALERVATSGNIAEVLSQVEYVQKVHTYDRDMLHEYENTVKEVEELNTTLQKDKEKLESLETEYTAQSEELKTTIESKSDEIENLDGMLQEAARAALEAQKKAEEEAAAAAAAAQAGQNNSGNNGSGNNNPSADYSAPAPNYNAATGNAVVDRAYSWVGIADYGWGACSPGLFDCSGFVSYCLTGSYSRLGTTYTFLAWPQVSDPQPGDVCVNADHCGIYIGGGQMIHAPCDGQKVQVGGVQGGMIYVRY